MQIQLEATLRCVVAAYTGIRLTDSDMKKLEVAANIATTTTICNIAIRGLIFTARLCPCEGYIKFSFHKENMNKRLTSLYIEEEILHVEDIKLC